MDIAGDIFMIIVIENARTKLAKCLCTIIKDALDLPGV